MASTLPAGATAAPVPAAPNVLPRLRATARVLAHPAMLGGLGALPWVVVTVVGPLLGTDLAAQFARGAFARAHPGAAYDFSWYGGLHPAAYSVLSPYLFAAIGVLATGALATIGASAAMADMFRIWDARRVRTAAVWTGLGTGASFFAGRVTFMLGLALAAAAVRLVITPQRQSNRRLAAAAVLAALCTLASPVATLFLGLTAVALLAVGPHRREGLVLGVAAALPMLGVQLVFPQWGVQPVTIDIAISPMIGALLVAWLVGWRHRALVVGCLIYSVGCLTAWLLPTPVGNNVERLGLILAAPVIAGLASRLRYALPVLLLLLTWQVYQPAGDIAPGPEPAAHASFSVPLLTALQIHGAQRYRIEVVSLSEHWEADHIARHYLLARGWERQLDTVRNPLFYDGPLNATTYHRWLRYNGVGFVALSDRPVDWGATGEAALVRSGLPYLHEVWSSDHWTLWRVVDPLPLTGPHAQVTNTSPAGLSLRVERPGNVLVRVRWSPWLHTSKGCLQQDGDWTLLHAPVTGSYRIDAPLTLPRGSACA
ncbi:MAG TPA: hypothetical protein VFJ21_07600 [Mycobacteriales bacterium]|jgi:hypothetical protein|nr:hypothetical protein [Mycobacteriales bacterium]